MNEPLSEDVLSLMERTPRLSDVGRLIAEVRRLRHEAEMAKQMLDAPKNCTDREMWRRNTAAWKILFDATREAPNADQR